VQISPVALICDYGGILLRLSHAQFTAYPLNSVQNCPGWRGFFTVPVTRHGPMGRTGLIWGEIGARKSDDCCQGTTLGTFSGKKIFIISALGQFRTNLQWLLTRAILDLRDSGA
jgi:hypothetical protein